MTPRDLTLVVMHVSTKCDQACAHCSIWKGRGDSEADLEFEARRTILADAQAAGARSVLFTGGEPLLCDHLEALCASAKGFRLSVQVATNGLGLARTASWLGALVDEVYVSLEGPEEIHDSVRGPRMFSRLAAALTSLRSLPRRPRLVGRSVISARNAAFLDQTVSAARSLGLDAVSFLRVDVTSAAFGGDPAGRAPLLPEPSAVEGMRRAITRLEARGELGAFVLEDAAKLSRLADSFGEASGLIAPACNAPEWSSVVEADGRVRPCFFQPAVARVDASVSLRALRNGSEYTAALAGLGKENPICAACVCPKHGSPDPSLASRVNAALTERMPRWLGRMGASA